MQQQAKRNGRNRREPAAGELDSVQQGGCESPAREEGPIRPSSEDRGHLTEQRRDRARPRDGSAAPAFPTTSGAERRRRAAAARMALRMTTGQAGCVACYDDFYWLAMSWAFWAHVLVSDWVLPSSNILSLLFSFLFSSSFPRKRKMQYLFFLDERKIEKSAHFASTNSIKRQVTLQHDGVSLSPFASHILPQSPGRTHV